MGRTSSEPGWITWSPRASCRVLGAIRLISCKAWALTWRQYSRPWRNHSVWRRCLQRAETPGAGHGCVKTGSCARARSARCPGRRCSSSGPFSWLARRPMSWACTRFALNMFCSEFCVTPRTLLVLGSAAELGEYAPILAFIRGDQARSGWRSRLLGPTWRRCILTSWPICTQRRKSRQAKPGVAGPGAPMISSLPSF